MMKPTALSRLLSGGAIAVLLAASAGQAQGQAALITGRVMGDRGDALGGAIVVVTQLNIGTATAADGRYSLTVPGERVHGQTVTLAARYIGYTAQSRQVTLVAGSQEQNFELVGDPLKLAEIVVTGTAAATRSEERRVGKECRL